METKTKELENKKNGKSTAVATLQKDISDTVYNRIAALEKEGGLQFPPNYSYANAIKSAWLEILKITDKNNNQALTICTKDSITNALLEMVIQGLSVSKKQCYFIIRGNQLCMDRSYFGSVAVTKRLKNTSDERDPFARIIYEGDVFEYHIDVKTQDIVIDRHDTKLENIDISKIKAAYTVVFRKDGSEYIEIMTKDQIRKAWEQGPMKGNSPAHRNFPEEMSKKTVLNRGCKMFINTSDDSDVLIESINRTTTAEYLDETEYEEMVENEVDENANKEMLDISTGEEQKETTDEEVQETDWESPSSVISAIESIKTTEQFNQFKKNNSKRLEVFEDQDKALIDKALEEKADKVLRGF